MSDEQNTLPSEVEENTSHTSTGDSNAEVGAGKKLTDSQDEDLSVDSLESSDEPQKSKSTAKESSKEEQERKQVMSWAEKIANGDRTIDELKKNKALSWLVDKVEDQLSGESTKNAEPIATLSDEEFEERYEKIQRKKQYQSVKSEVESLPSQYRNEVIRTAKSYMSDLGASAELALPKALEQIQGKLQQDGVKRSAKISGGATPIANYSTGSSHITMEQLAGLSQAEYEKVSARMQNGEVRLVEG